MKAAAAARRIPIVGTAVVIAPVLEAAAPLTSTSLTSRSAWESFAKNLIFNFSGVSESGTVDGGRIIKTYLPIGVYLIARAKAGKHLSRIFRPLGLRF